MHNEYMLQEIKDADSKKIEKEGIPYVDARLSKEELAKYDLSESENKLEVDGEKFSLYIMDFRKEKGETSSEVPHKIDIYAMGFMETDPVNPNELSAAIIKRAQENGSVLVIPRFENLPKNPASNAEAELALKGLRQLEAKFKDSGIEFDFSTHDVEIIGFSDGERTALELAGLIDKIPAEKNVTRKLKPLSPTALVDLIEVEDIAKGKEVFANFVKQVTWITLEETRLRLNAVIKKEQQRFEDDYYRRMADGTLDGAEKDTSVIVKKSVGNRLEDGSLEYPLLLKGIKEISAPLHANDIDSMKDTANAILKLLSFKEGQTLFATQFKESLGINIPFLTDVVNRAITANQEFKPEDFNFNSGKFFNSLSELIKVYPNLLEQIKSNETRSPTCDTLYTFDVDAVLPREDLVFPAEAYGRTIRSKILNPETSSQFPPNVNVVVMEQIEHALAMSDDKMLGDLCAKYPEYFARTLFPNAKSVNIRFMGDLGSLSGSHLAPLKAPEVFGM